MIKKAAHMRCFFVAQLETFCRAGFCRYRQQAIVGSTIASGRLLASQVIRS